MKTPTEKNNEKQPAQQRHRSNEPSSNATATILDNRPRTVYQRQLQKTMDAHAAAKAAPIQRRPVSGSSRFRQIAGDMGAQYGVDTSGLKATHHSSFPTSLNAEATIQGNNIHFAPGKDTNYNIRHEVAHAIDNTINGTPKGDQVVNGQKVDTTREQVVDRMTDIRYSPEGKRIQPKSSLLDHELFQLKKLGDSIEREKLNVVGENHDDSGKVRYKERAYTKSKFGEDSCYWKEGEFSFFSKDFGLLAGDDNYLRFLSLISLFLDHYNDQEKAQQSLGKAVLSASRIEGFYSIYNRNNHYSKDGIPILRREETRNLANLINERLQEIKENKENKSLLKQLKVPITKYLEKDQDVITYKKRGFLGNCLRSANPNVMKLSKKRSLWMHVVAKRASNKKGIWKVGNNHVKHINSMKEEGDYNLLDKMTFHRIVKQYKSNLPL